jgi:hypothetical protein
VLKIYIVVLKHADFVACVVNVDVKNLIERNAEIGRIRFDLRVGTFARCAEKLFLDASFSLIARFADRVERLLHGATLQRKTKL